MVGEIEMQTLYGVCRYCGEQRIVNAADQEDANYKVTNQCTCPDALFYKKRMQIAEMIRETCSGDCAVTNGFISCDSDQVQAIINMAELVQLRKFAKVQITMFDSVLAISINSDGVVKVNRTRKMELESEV